MIWLSPRLRSSLGLAACLLLVSACGDDAATPAAPATSAASTASTSTTGKTNGQGLHHPDNAAPVVKVAKTALRCAWSGHGFESGCPGTKLFLDSPALANGAADPTLVRMLDDEDEKVRFLAAMALQSKGLAYRTDPTLAAALLAALAREKSTAVGIRLGSAAGLIDPDKAKARATQEKLARELGVNAVRASLLRGLQRAHPDTFFDLTADIAKSDVEEQLRTAALGALADEGTPAGKRDALCALLAGLLTDPRPSVSGKACSILGQTAERACAAHYGALFDAVAARAKAGEATHPYFASALKYVHQQKDAPPAEKARALEIASALLANEKNDALARASALAFLVEEGGKGPDFAKRYEKDPQAEVAARATRLVKGEKPRSPRLLLE